VTDPTPIRPQVVPSYMGCTFETVIRRDGVPEIVGRREGIAYFVVKRAPGGEGRLIADEIADHLNGRECAEREVERLRAENAELRARLAVHH
jgi:hypothetical protein